MEDFPRIHNCGILSQIQKMMGELQCEPENFFTSMFDDIQVSIDSEVAVELAAESMEIPTGLPIAGPHTDAELQGNLLRD